MPPTLTCYGGVREIGGTKIFLEDGELRVFLDFGMAFGRYGSYFDGVFTKERSVRGLLDLVALGLLPPLRGLLRDDLVPVLDPAHLASVGTTARGRVLVSLTADGEGAFWDYWQRRLSTVYRDLRRDSAPPADAVLLSHAHQDHISDAMYLVSSVPAVSSRMAAFISKVLADVGMQGQGVPYSNPYTLAEDGSRTVARDEGYRARPWHFLDGDPQGQPDQDALASAVAFWAASPSKKSLSPLPASLPRSLHLRYWPVDHSIFGAVGYAVETSSGWVAYSGDLRAHGRFGERMQTFAEALHELHPIALLCEGTRLGSVSRTTEAEVHDNCLAAIRSAAGQLVVADFAPRNVERLETFITIAGETERCLLVQPRDAYLLRAMHLADPTVLPDWMTDSRVALYADPKAAPRRWEQHLRARYQSRIVSPLDVSRRPGDYILAFSLTDLADLLDIQYLMNGHSQGLYVFSNSPAFDDEQKVDLVRLWNWTDHLGLRVVGLKRPHRDANGVLLTEAEHGYHASGHAGEDDLVRFVQTVRPVTLIPIHTEQPERWAELLAGTGIAITMPQPNRPITLC